MELWVWQNCLAEYESCDSLTGSFEMHHLDRKTFCEWFLMYQRSLPRVKAMIKCFFFFGFVELELSLERRRVYQSLGLFRDIYFLLFQPQLCTDSFSCQNNTKRKNNKEKKAKHGVRGLCNHIRLYRGT